MTTLAYKDGVIAYDSRLTQGDIIHTDNAEKKYVRDGVSFFLCGNVCDYKDAISEWFGDTIAGNLEANGFVSDNEGVIWEFGSNESFWRNRIDISKSYSYGTGRRFALTAMDLGLSAKDAVKMAIKRDVYSGGKVNTFKCNAKG